jgi:hypothetical protein
MSSVLGTPAIKHKSYVHDRERPPAENISVHLLEQFDEASDSEGDEILVHDGRAAVAAAVEPHAVTEKGEKKKWGPVLATRVSNRIKKDGKSAIEKAQEIKMKHNLEKPKSGMSNSFAVFDDDYLSSNASGAGICLGNDSMEVSNNICKMKKIEEGRLDMFHSCNPDMFLPANIDLCKEDMEKSFGDNSGLDVEPSCSSERDRSFSVDIPHSSEDVDESPWMEVFSKKGSGSRRKLIFKSNGCRSYLESTRS